MSMNVYASHLTDEVIGNQKESIVKRYVTFSSWLKREITAKEFSRHENDNFSFSAIKKSLPMFKSSTSPMQKRSIVTIRDFVRFYWILVSFGLEIFYFFYIFFLPSFIAFRFSRFLPSFSISSFFRFEKFFSRVLHQTFVRFVFH